MKKIIVLAALLALQLCLGCAVVPYRAYRPEPHPFWGPAPFHEHVGFNDPGPAGYPVIR